MNDKKERVSVVTPVGRFSYPFLIDKNTRGDSPYQGTDLLIYTKTLQESEVEKKLFDNLKETILKVGREYFKNPALELKDFKNPLNPAKLTDNDPKITDPAQKGAIILRAKYYANEEKGYLYPLVVNAEKKEMSVEEARKIRGGDWGRLSLGIFGYNVKGQTGVTFAINAVQFWKKDTAFGGGGVEKAISGFSVMEIPVSDAPDASGLMDATSKFF